MTEVYYPTDEPAGSIPSTMPRRNRNWKLVLSAFLGIALTWIPGLWIPGMFVAAILFPEGIHSDHPYLFFVLAILIDFLLYAGVTYCFLKAFAAWKVGSKPKRTA